MSVVAPWYNQTAVEHYGLLAIDCLELLIQQTLTCPISALNFFLVLRTSVLHPNLKFILLCQSTFIFTRSIGRSLIMVMKLRMDNTFWSNSAELSFLFSFSSFFRNFLAHVLVIERVMATLYVRKYEHLHRPYFSIAWFVLGAVFSFVNSQNSIKNVTLNLLSWTLVLVLGLTELLVFAWIWCYNGRVFKDKFFTRHSLSERYQLAENIRTAKQLVPTLLIHFLNIFVACTVNWCNYFLIFGSPTTKHLLAYGMFDHLFYCIIATNNFLIELSLILCHPYLRRNFFALLRQARSVVHRAVLCPFGRRISPAPTMFGSANNKNNSYVAAANKMNIQDRHHKFTGNEAEEHFEQLKRIWEGFEKRK